MLKGSCLCAAVTWTADVDHLTGIGMCHCQMCRKASGTAFGTNCSVPRAAFSLRDPHGVLRSYASSAGKQRHFCGRCGSPIYSENAKRPDELRIRLGTLDTPIDQRPEFHFMVKHMAEWDAITDDLPQHTRLEPHRAED